VPANRVSQNINGKQAITGDTALRLGHWFRTSAEFRLNLQAVISGFIRRTQGREQPVGRVHRRLRLNAQNSVSVERHRKYAPA
jgi:plasmid maintenance system antidote protein VapI